MTTSTEQTAVLVYVPNYYRLGNSPLWFNVTWLGDEIQHVDFPATWRREMRDLGYPEQDWVEGYLIGTVHRAAMNLRY